MRTSKIKSFVMRQEKTHLSFIKEKNRIIPKNLLPTHQVTIVINSIIQISLAPFSYLTLATDQKSGLKYSCKCLSVAFPGLMSSKSEDFFFSGE